MDDALPQNGSQLSHMTLVAVGCTASCSVVVVIVHKLNFLCCCAGTWQTVSRHNDKGKRDVDFEIFDFAG